MQALAGHVAGRFCLPSAAIAVLIQRLYSSRECGYGPQVPDPQAAIPVAAAMARGLSRFAKRIPRLSASLRKIPAFFKASAFSGQTSLSRASVALASQSMISLVPALTPISIPRFGPVGLSFSAVRPRDLLDLPLRQLVASCDRIGRPGKSSSPPPLAPSSKIQGDATHNNSGVSVLNANTFPERMAVGTIVLRIRIKVIFYRVEIGSYHRGRAGGSRAQGSASVFLTG
jgi:hypothetical protein